MGKRDPRIDGYIAKSADFAKPILAHLREVVHSACPEVEESWKWSSPSFVYKGMLCGMAACKAHCAFGFWKGSLVVGGEGDGSAMGHFGRITRLADLPPKKVLVGYIRKAIDLNDRGVKNPTRARPKTKKAVVVPNALKAALGKNKAARATFDGFSPSKREEYVEWLTEAKTDETRTKRLLTAIEWMAEGKPRNWKYMK